MLLYYVRDRRSIREVFNTQPYLLEQFLSFELRKISLGDYQATYVSVILCVPLNV